MESRREDDIVGQIGRRILAGDSHHQLARRFDGTDPLVAAELKKILQIENARQVACPSVPKDELSTPDHQPRIPDFKLLRKIDAGGFGIVWLGQNVHDELYYAVKVLHAGRESDLDGVRELKRRAEANQYLMPVLHVGQCDAGYYYIMPLADAASESRTIVSPDSYEPYTLQYCLDRPTLLPAHDIYKLTIDLLHGIRELHQSGAIHRDVKPANIMRLDGAWRLGDPGLITSDSSADSAGTPDFSPPDSKNEQSADLFGLGKTVLMLCGENGESQTVGRIATRERQLDDTRERLIRSAARACHPEPSERFTSAQQMLDDLVPSPGRFPVRWRFLAAAMVIVILLSLRSAVLSRNHQDHETPTTQVVSLVVESQPARLRDFEIRVIDNADRGVFHVIGDERFHASSSSFFRVVIEFEFSCYAKVIAFYPDGNMLDLTPESNEEPQRVQRLILPSGESGYPLGISGTDTTGLFMIAVVASPNPLSWNTLEKDKGPFPDFQNAFQNAEESSFVWIFSNGSYDRVADERSVAVKLFSAPECFKRIADHLWDSDSSVIVEARAFSLIDPTKPGPENRIN
jgi:serine/threonine protein kinase